MKDYGRAWNELKTWARREKELLERSSVRNHAQEQTINALLYRMEQAESGDPYAFDTI
jgi:hypothetical protein